MSSETSKGPLASAKKPLGGVFPMGATQDPTMVMPVDTDVHINLTSTDVLHGFYVEAFNFSRYALPGVRNQFTFHAVQTEPSTASAPSCAGFTIH